jgi:hypothetical protein
MFVFSASVLGRSVLSEAKYRVLSFGMPCRSTISIMRNLGLALVAWQIVSASSELAAETHLFLSSFTSVVVERE